MLTLLNLDLVLLLALAAVVAKRLAEVWMERRRGLAGSRLQVRLGYDAKGAPDRTEYQRVTLVREGSELVATSTGSQSSSRLLSLVGAHALVRIPPGGPGIPAGTVVEAIILSLP